MVSLYQISPDFRFCFLQLMYKLVCLLQQSYINTLVTISSYYEQTYLFVSKHILPCLMGKSVALVHFNII